MNPAAVVIIIRRPRPAGGPLDTEYPYTPTTGQSDADILRSVATQIDTEEHGPTDPHG